ncbi:hypothetical protein Ccrd_020771 [Cynara cardunculus var. scolymus]|uniref:Helicase, C-terminal n=1 Tax=Cynara cardunculus var. scolymus TaxID=59895 RepID=A0A103Y1T1_CYNCS|nr:hypothetical protein Ccrd_020771 [Cynara cardunculus var. scolymus]
MMMEKGGTACEWQVDDFDVGITADDDDLSMDIESLLSILEESQPDDSTENRVRDPSSSITPCSEPFSHAAVNEHFGTHNGSLTFSPSDQSGASTSGTVCSGGSFESERQMVNFGITKNESRPDVSSLNYSSASLGDWAIQVPGNGTPYSPNTGVAQDLSSFSHHDTRETNFERANSSEVVGFSDWDGDQQLMDVSDITDGIYHDSVADSCRTSEAQDIVEAQFLDFSRYSDIVYGLPDASSMPYFMSVNEPSRSGPSRPYHKSGLSMIRNDRMLFNVKTESAEHLMHNSFLNSTMNYNSRAEKVGGVSLTDQSSYIGPYVGAEGSNVCLPTGENSGLPAKEYASGRRFPGMFHTSNKTLVNCLKDEKSEKGLLQSFSGVFDSILSNDHVMKGEQDDIKRSRHFINIIDNTCRSNTPLSDNCRSGTQSPEQSFFQSDTSIKKQLTYIKEDKESNFSPFNNMALFPQKISQQAVPNTTFVHSTYVDDGDPDICILEDMSEPAPKKLYPVDGKSVVTAQFGASPTQMGFNNTRLKTNDERLIYRAALQDLSQPKSEATPPDGALAVPLLRHQRIALSWMVQKETRSMHCFGGILADDQGLGKTISTIALILKERSPSSNVDAIEVKKEVTETLNLDDDDDTVTEPCAMAINGSSIEPKITPLQTNSRPAAGTLVVCPTSVLRQWNDELHNKVSSKSNLSVLVYHGGNRTKDPFELAKYDVVLTTYAIVSMEVPKQPLVDEDDDETKKRNEFQPVGLSSTKKRKYPPTSGNNSKKGKKEIDNELFESLARPLAKVRWFRVVLDEAQSIKNHKTQVARACWGLRAKRRWCLSGTPIQNAIDDLYSYFRFLRYDPYAVYTSFCSTIKIPIQRSPVNGYKKLQAVLKTIMLRRTKGEKLEGLFFYIPFKLSLGTLLDGEPIVSLPPKTVNLKKVDFTAEEREFYCRLEADSRAQFAEYAAAGTVKQNYVNILLMLLRLRQACDHPLLVKGCNSNSEWRSSLEKAKKLTPEKRTRLLNCLEASLAICSICNDPPEDAVVTTCEHVFCNQCILEQLSSDDCQCPSSKCKTLLGTSSVFSRSTLRLSTGDQPGLGNTPDCSGSVKTEVLEPCSSIGLVNSSKIDAAEALDSSKIRAAVDVLQSIAKPQETTTNPEDGLKDVSGVFNMGTVIVREKAIVFSQWTRMLDLLESCLKDSSIGYRRLDGTMSVVARDKAVKDFNSLPEVTVMIMSLKAASLGLNMVAACHVLLLDLWWNPTTEDQAIDRAHRIGQTRPVTVLRLTVRDTVEDRILALQQKKREMVSSAFGEDETGSRQTRLTVDDLKYLFQA